ncbi:MFS transporter [Microbispora rosea]|uniref:Predicted arabinose efflux permease, MFS family n=1 Tax=Microbispora rosea TaxID=58117 RepID=A0A1N7HBG9_9ACTN|nr:MFS transporter [Microbispora rosea]GIH52452.1 MFS transporter [Microbispora rosea subsp. rosea]SIS22028.1 Predicted arabinose efflux permease, MFS family [Microbispora rosea]
MTPSPATSPRHRPGLTLLTTGFGTLLVLIDYTAPLTTLTPNAAALRMGPSAQTWVLTGTLVGLAALLLTMGSAADDYGRKRVFGAGAVLLLISTLLSALAPDTAVFLAGRILQGCAAAAILAPTLGLIGNVYPAGPARVKALGRWSASIGLGIATGPIYAAFLEDAGGWRTVYAVLAALSAVLILLTAYGLDESGTARPRKLDPFGVVTLAAGSSCLVAGLAEGRDGWGRAPVLILLVVGVLFLVGFAVVECRVAEPMLDVTLFRNSGFVASSAGALFTGLSIVGLMSYLPTVLQKSLGETSLTASLVLAIWSGLSVVSALQARRLAGVAATTQVAGSLLVCGIGEAALLGLHVGSSWTHLVPGLVIAGIGSGILNAALARLAVGSVPSHRAAMGSGANNSFRYLGSALGVAIVATVVSQATSPRGPAYAMADGANRATAVTALLCAIGATVALWARIAGARATADGPSDSGRTASPAFDTTGS